MTNEQLAVMLRLYAAMLEEGINRISGPAAESPGIALLKNMHRQMLEEADVLDGTRDRSLAKEQMRMYSGRRSMR